MPAGAPEGLLEIGRIAKPHGIRGEVVVAPVTNRHERFTPGAVHHTDRGRLTVRSARRHQGRWIVSYDDIRDRSEAEEWRGVLLRGEPIETLDEEGEWWVHDLVGSEVVDQHGTVHGTVLEVEANPAHDILVLDRGGLVPVVFVTTVAEGRVQVEVPDGLLDPDMVDANLRAVERRTPGRKGGGSRRRPPGRGASS